MKLVIGLGNPGNKYEKTRHNIGWRVLDALASKHELEWKQALSHEASIAELSAEEKVLLVKPQTFVNLSGKAVASLLNFYQLDPQGDLLVVYDDKDMLFGKLRERQEGSSGGHNGIKSIIDSVGREAFHRLKFGVGHEDQRIPTDAFVLQPFTEAEERLLPELIDEAVSAVEGWVRKGS